MNIDSWRRFWVGGVALALLAVLGFALGDPRAESSLPRVAVPNGGICPDVVFQAGTLQVVFGREGGDTYYTRSADEGKTLSTPVRINSGSSRATLGHERGPKLAIGRSGSIHVAWLGSGGKQVFYASSTDGGQRFSSPRNLVADDRGVDGATIAADDSGHVSVVWLGGGEGPDSPVSSLIQLASSDDNGNTFAPPRTVASDYPGGACACCNLKASVGPGGSLLIGFRGAYRSIRDMYVLRGMPDARRFEATRVSDDRWRLDICPMQGLSLQVTDRPPQIGVAWMSEGRVYRSFSTDGGKSFRPRIAPARAYNGSRRDPIAPTNPQGETLFAWVEGRSVYWERSGSSGRVVHSGENGGLPSNSKPAAFVDRSGNFALVY